MATMPIEVIVQDVEIPVPETDTTETITGTPDTGSGIVGNSINGNNGIFSSSASAIILPAILLTLALGAIVTLFIRKYLRKGRISTSRKKKLVTITASAVLMITAAVLVGNLLIPATKATTGDNDEDNYITPLDEKISIVATRENDETEASIESTSYATVTTNLGHEILLAMVGDTANLYLDGDTNSEYYIVPTENKLL